MPQPIEAEPWWQERYAQIRSRPPADGLRRLARAISRGSTVTRTRRLGGGIGTATSAVTLRTSSGRTVAVILKRFPRDRGDKAVEEWRRLRFAQRLPVPSPEPIAIDRTGEWFGAPALVMARLPGRPDVTPRDVPRWLDEFAKVQATLHSVRVARPPGFLLGPEALVAQSASGLTSSPVVDAASRYVRRRIARARIRDVVVAHGDAHPGNMLWRRGRVSGVTDWAYAGMLPRGHEVAYARTDIAVLLGPRAADDYLVAYEHHSGVRVRDLAVWDLRQGLGALRWSPLWALAYREQGAALTAATAKRRATAFVKRVLANA